MEINKAIYITRGLAKMTQELGEKYARGNRELLAAEVAFEDAEALETVCDTLEAFLKKQEEDNSYHTKG